MKEGPDIALLASLIGDPARANMLIALMSGMALTAGELALEADITPQTASGHLAKLKAASLVIMEIQGRHRYFRLAGSDVADALEGLMELASRKGRLRSRPGPRDAALRKARVCYDHLAGAMGVRLHDALVSQGYIVATIDGLGISTIGHSYFRAEGVHIGAATSRGRPMCRTCLDWSERRHHLAGSVGAALLAFFFAKGWARRESRSRAVIFSTQGLASFERFIRSAESQASPAAASG